MKNLKQLLTERKYLEAKTLVLENREDLEGSIDTLIEAVECGFVTSKEIVSGVDTKAYSINDYVTVKIDLSTVTPPETGQTLYWNEEKKELECKTEDLGGCVKSLESNPYDIKTASGALLDNIGVYCGLGRVDGDTDVVYREKLINYKPYLDKPSALEEA